MNETDTFADEDGANDEYFDFEDVRLRRLLPDRAGTHLKLCREHLSNAVVWCTEPTGCLLYRACLF